MASTVRLRADQLTRIRRRNNLDSDGELASRAGLNRTYLNLLINGHRYPGPKAIAGLCDALNVRFEELFEVVEKAA